MKINLNDFKIRELSITNVSELVELIEKCKYDVSYSYLNQIANAKSVINLLAINICNEPHGTLSFSEKESQKKISEIIKFLKNLL